MMNVVILMMKVEEEMLKSCFYKYVIMIMDFVDVLMKNYEILFWYVYYVVSVIVNMLLE